MDPVRSRVVELICHDCVIRLLLFMPHPNDPEAYIDVQLISSTSERWMGRWRNRVRNAWAVLRYRYDWSGFWLDTRKEAEDLADALRSGIEEVWPSGPSVAPS